MVYYLYINRNFVINKELRDRLFKCLNTSKKVKIPIISMFIKDTIIETM